MGRFMRALVGGAFLVSSFTLAGCSAPADDAPTPTTAPTIAPADQPDDETSATLVLTGAEIGATASSALADQVSGVFEIFCDEGEYEVTAGTQLTCTYADDNGDTPAYIKVTAVEGSEYELSVSVP